MKLTVWIVWTIVVGIAAAAAEDRPFDKIRWSFEDTPPGAIPEGWTIAETHGVGAPAVWKIVELDDAPCGKQAFALTETNNPNPTFNLAILEEIQCRDVELEVRLKAVSGNLDQGGGLIWRAQDQNNYYIVRWNPLEDNVRLYYVKDGKRVMLQSVEIKADPGRWREIDVETHGPAIRVKFDGKTIFDLEDSTFLEAGAIGLWTKADAATLFDELVVEIED